MIVIGGANRVGGTPGTARLTPLTGMLMTVGNGGLAVRRIRVRVMNGQDRGREAMLEAGTLLVGTHTHNDLVLRDGMVGENHLELALVASGVRIRDLGTEHGTTVAGARVSTKVVVPGTEIVVGRTTLHLIPADVLVSVPPSDRGAFGPVLGHAPRMREMIALLERIAPTDSPVLVEGEPGSGRTLVSRAIHASSRFAASPVTSVDFSRPVERHLLEQIAQRTDTFTLLLEHIELAHSSLSAPLLALYERREEGVLDARIVATSARHLEATVTDARWKRELFAHITAVRVIVPPLRERMEDVPLLTRQFAKEICGTDVLFEEHDFDRICARTYTGNVKELKTMILRAAMPEPAARALLPRSGIERARAALVLPLNARPKPPSMKVARDRIVEAFERDWLEKEWVRAGQNLDILASNTGSSRENLQHMLEHHGLIVPPAPPSGRTRIVSEKKPATR